MKPYNLINSARLIIRNIQNDDKVKTVDAKLLKIPAAKRGQDFASFSEYCRVSGLSNMAGMKVFVTCFVCSIIHT